MDLATTPAIPSCHKLASILVVVILAVAVVTMMLFGLVPARMLVMDSLGLMLLPPMVSVPMVMFIPFAFLGVASLCLLLGPRRMMLVHPSRIVVNPPFTIVPLVVLDSAAYLALLAGIRGDGGIVFEPLRHPLMHGEIVGVVD
jgi:hypothetical protein